ncbi:MAG: hypothetical protein LBS77_02995 [Desulfovibrio sp.]|nr:hypothetical protein [Desulfovibrio sp.]
MTRLHGQMNRDLTSCETAIDAFIDAFYYCLRRSHRFCIMTPIAKNAVFLHSDDGE